MRVVVVVIKAMLVAIALVAIVPTTAMREDHEQLVGVVVVETTTAWVVGMGRVRNRCQWKDGTIGWSNWNPLLLPTLPETIITVWIGPDH